MIETSEPVRLLTNSEAQTFKDCRRRWYLSYHLRLRKRRQRPDGPLTIGSRVHEALAALYDVEPGDPLEVYRLQCEADWAKLDEVDLADEKLVKRLESEMELGRIMVEGFMDWREEQAIDRQLVVVGPERKVEVYLRDASEAAERPLGLLGKLDVEVLDQFESRRFIDHKTTASFDVTRDEMRLSEQFLMYQLIQLLDELEQGVDPDEAVVADGGLVNALRKVKRTAAAKPPFYERFDVYHGREELRAFWTKIHGLLTDVIAAEAQLEAGADHRFVAYPRPTRDCRWKCEFYAVCPMMDDGSAWERFITDFFEEYDPLTRYDVKDEEPGQGS